MERAELGRAEDGERVLRRGHVGAPLWRCECECECSEGAQEGSRGGRRRSDSKQTSGAGWCHGMVEYGLLRWWAGHRSQRAMTRSTAARSRRAQDEVQTQQLGEAFGVSNLLTSVASGLIGDSNRKSKAEMKSS